MLQANNPTLYRVAPTEHNGFIDLNYYKAVAPNGAEQQFITNKYMRIFEIHPFLRY